MSDHWHVLDSGPGAPDYNMALDEALLECVNTIGGPVLRFYSWTVPAATFGYSQRYKEIENLTKLRPLIRRPTGGGLVPHDADWTYSMVFPANAEWYQLRAIESYERAHQKVRDAFRAIGVEASLAPEARKEIPGQCFIGCEKHDVLWHGRKIAGAAQRRTKAGLLIQGSVQPPPLNLSRAEWQKAMRQVNGSSFALPDEIVHRAEVLCGTKYGIAQYNEKR